MQRILREKKVYPDGSTDSANLKEMFVALYFDPKGQVRVYSKFLCVRQPSSPVVYEWALECTSCGLEKQISWFLV